MYADGWRTMPTSFAEESAIRQEKRQSRKHEAGERPSKPWDIGLNIARPSFSTTKHPTASNWAHGDLRRRLPWAISFNQLQDLTNISFPISFLVWFIKCVMFISPATALLLVVAGIFRHKLSIKRDSARTCGFRLYELYLFSVNARVRKGTQKNDFVKRENFICSKFSQNRKKIVIFATELP